MHILLVSAHEPRVFLVMSQKVSVLQKKQQRVLIII